MARAERWAGRSTAVLEVLREATELAESTAYRPIVAEAKLELGLVLEGAGKPDEAISMLEEACFTAGGIPHESLATQAAAELARLVAGQDVAAGRTWGRHAAMALERTRGEDALLAAAVAIGRGVAAHVAGDYQAAYEHSMRALELAL